VRPVLRQGRHIDAATTIRLEVVPLTKRIGREIRGIDLRDDLTPSNFFRNAGRRS
jgi:hypothetical protein